MTLEELASHRSGLPSATRQSTSQLVLEDLAGEELTFFAKTSTPELLERTKRLELTHRGTYAYSNLGAALLGHALARAGDAPDWPAYLHERLLDPLGMTDTRVSPPGQPEPDLLTPHLAGGRVVEPWTGEGYAPAGVGVTTTAADLTKYAGAILDGTAPGVSALAARWETTGPLAAFTRVGLAWMSSGPPEQAIAWHSGGTGGTRTMIAIDPAQQQAVIVLNNSRKDVIWGGLRLMGVDEGLPPQFALNISERTFYPVIGLAVVLVFLVGVVRERNRLGLIARAAWGIGGLLLWWMAAPWDWLPGWVFGAALGATILASVVVALRWPGLAARPNRFLWLAIPMLVLGMSFFVLMTWAAIRTLQVA